MLAGAWANRNQQRTESLVEGGFLGAGDIDEALNAASQIGDHRLARASGRAVAPDSFTHGASQQRVNWWSTRGLESGRVQSCDTFSGAL